jgi:hypothetical protein
MATVVILSDEAQNPLTPNDHHTMATVNNNTHIHKYYHIRPKIPEQQMMTNQPTLIIIQIEDLFINLFMVYLTTLSVAWTRLYSVE